MSVVKEWIELWANSLHAAGVPREKIFCHIAFTDQGLRKADAKESYVEKVAFAPPEVAFSSAYRPGFSTYPEGRTFKEVYAALAEHGSPGWISAEGTNVSPTSMPGEPTMETYLGRMFNHGGVMVNVFSWGIGGEAHAQQLLPPGHGESRGAGRLCQVSARRQLVESAAQGFSATRFQDKMHRIQAEASRLGAKIGKAGAGDAADPKTPIAHQGQEMAGSGQGGRRVAGADEGRFAGGSEDRGTAPHGTLPPKIHRIQKELPAWIGADADKKNKATALMQQLQEHLKATNFDEAEKTADSILKMMGVSAGAAAQDAPVAAETDSADAMHKRLMEKVARVKQGAKVGGQRARSVGDLQDDDGEVQAAHGRGQSRRSGSGTGSCPRAVKAGCEARRFPSRVA